MYENQTFNLIDVSFGNKMDEGKENHISFEIRSHRNLLGVYLCRFFSAGLKLGWRHNYSSDNSYWNSYCFINLVLLEEKVNKKEPINWIVNILIYLYKLNISLIVQIFDVTFIKSKNKRIILIIHLIACFLLIGTTWFFLLCRKILRNILYTIMIKCLLYLLVDCF